MAKIKFKIFVYLITIGNGIIVKSSSPEEHNPPVTENVEELEEISTLFSPSSILTSSSSEKPPDEPATSSSKEPSIKASGEDFNPSVYLGEIKEIESQSRISTSVPFNNVQHVRFEGSIGLDGSNTGMIYRQPSSYHHHHNNDHHHYHTDHRQEDSHPPSAYAEGYMSVEMPTKPVYYTSEEPNHYVNVEIQPHEYAQSLQSHQQHIQPLQSHQQHIQTLQPHEYLQTIQPHHQHHQYPPIKYEFEPVQYHHHHNHHPTANYYHYSSQVPSVPRPEVTLTKPETLLYLSSHRETSLMKTRKFPYKYYQPNDDIPIHYIEQGHAFPTQHIRVSPWKKLIHLIGAFLPFGLLLAALKPNIKIDPANTTQPNIVLSKWRGIDLPVEHKGDVDDVCEDKSLCEIILSGSEENAELVHSILWNFAIKSNDEEAHRNGLGEIFNGVKKKDCNLIRC